MRLGLVLAGRWALSTRGCELHRKRAKRVHPTACAAGRRTAHVCGQAHTEGILPPKLQLHWRLGCKTGRPPVPTPRHSAIYPPALPPCHTHSHHSPPTPPHLEHSPSLMGLSEVPRNSPFSFRNSTTVTRACTGAHMPRNAGVTRDLLRAAEFDITDFLDSPGLSHAVDMPSCAALPPRARLAGPAELSRDQWPRAGAE
jgi:hypothetical protein